MALISPFQAWRYDPERVPVQMAVTQPYDKITPAMQERYYQASPFNMVRIILGKPLPGDGDAENVYTRAAASFQNWRQTGVLRQDPEPSVYRYSQTFRIPGDVPGSQTQAERRSFIALGRIEDYSAGVVFRHEQTLAKPKVDRLDLLRASRAHFGQIFMLYSGAGKVDAQLDSAAATFKAPDIEVTDEYDVVHRVWKISDPSVIASVQQHMRDRKLIIADGHHRYETALAYRHERRAQAETGSGLPVLYDSVMMTFVDIDRSDMDRSDKGRTDKIVLLTVAPAWSSSRRTASSSACHLFRPRTFRRRPRNSSTSKKSMPASTRRAPPPFCSTQDTRERLCSRSLPGTHFCCTHRRPSAVTSSETSRCASKRST